MARAVGTAVVALACLALSVGCSPTGGSPVDTVDTGDPVDRADRSDPVAALRERCLSAIPDAAEVEALDLEGRAGGAVSAARFPPTAAGEGDGTTLVLLPQVGGGLCGWGRFATLAAERGFESLAVEPCGYGATECGRAADDDPLHEVAPAVEAAREAGASRVVLVGASMGGSLSVMAVEAGAEVDGWVDVSGPSAWDGVELVSLADGPGATGWPRGLVLQARSDGESEFAAARTLARRADARFVGVRSGHGYELLASPDGTRVLRGGRLVLGFAAG